MEKPEPSVLEQAWDDLAPEDRDRIQAIREALPLLADVAHADLLVYLRAGDAAVAVDHAAPHPVPYLYPRSEKGRVLQRRDSSVMFRALHSGREHQS